MYIGDRKGGMRDNDPTNGGRRISQLEVTDAKHGTNIALLIRQGNETHKMLKEMLVIVKDNQKEIACNQTRISSNRDWINALWAFGIVLIAIAAKAAFSK